MDSKSRREFRLQKKIIESELVDKRKVELGSMSIEVINDLWKFRILTILRVLKFQSLIYPSTPPDIMNI